MSGGHHHQHEPYYHDDAYGPPHPQDMYYETGPGEYDPREPYPLVHEQQQQQQQQQQQHYYDDGGDLVDSSAAYDAQRGTYFSEDSRAEYYRQNGYGDEYGADVYPAEAYTQDPYYGPDSRVPYDRKGKRNGSSEEGSETYSDFKMRPDVPRPDMDYGRMDERYNSYGYSSESVSQVAGGRNYYGAPSSHVSYGANRSSGASTPIYGLDYQNGFMGTGRSREPYPAWTSDAQIPLSKEEVEDIFIDLANKFGFQRDSMRNMYDFMMSLLDSRASRMTPNQALLSLHADYIGGENANYRKWYFAAHLDLDDNIGFANMKLGKTNRRTRRARRVAKKTRPTHTPEQTLQELEGDYSLEAGEYRWKTRMNQMSQHERARQIALYLLCWGEANQVRFIPECLCFIFKCADDYYISPECQAKVEPVEEGLFLRNVITPLYRYIRDQGYEIVDGKYVRRERDHNRVIGYDDINQLFWYPEGIERIVMSDKTRLIDVPTSQRYLKFGNIDWKKAFFKTYKETRSWLHLATNFNRIWIIHMSMFWYFTAYNAPTLYTENYQQRLNNPPNSAAQLSAIALGGAISTLLMILGTVAEYFHVPRKFPGAQPLTRRMICLIVVFLLNIAPTVYIIGFGKQTGTIAHALGIVQLLFALACTLFFSIMPLGALFWNIFKTRKYLSNEYFTASYPRLEGNYRWMSYGLWALIFAAKFVESYFFLTLSFKDSIRVLSTMTVKDCSVKIFDGLLCQYHPYILLGTMFVTDLFLFFLDTYLWYIIWNTIFSVARSFYLGISIWTPWRNIFSRLPKRIYSKILATSDMDIKYKPKVLISQIWNAVVISMYREHLLSIDHVQRLLYHQVPSEQEGKRTLKAPTFFVAQEDHSFQTEFYPVHSEAERRISFFAQSLSTPIPEPLPVDNMPTFTVLVPHYSEKILLSLREIIREEDQLSRVTLLEYLKQLHPVEWECFVKDTKVLARENSALNGEVPFEKDDKETVKSKNDDLPFYCIGFKSAAPEYTLRTRIWASLRSQTLYRTVSGFMNYPRAIKLLYRVENPEVVQMFGGNSDKLDRELERMARRKFKFVISMQRYTKFSKEEQENTEFLLRAYPDLQIAYLDEEPPSEEGGEPLLFSSLIDGHCEIMENGRRRPKFRIQLSGNPILGDGKSDNQNHSIIFYRGEYIQLIDANQDNYLEECLKIRSVLAEFEEMNVEPGSPYTPGLVTSGQKHPVAILGAREYIFSENVGVLGDVAAGKEQTFGTLFSRTLAQIGGKLHYGHPDFLNGVFMTTRGGVSKAQKGLHLNEDIYAGMNAMLRGGRIKHCEYYQCGKGRDLGFGSILNFTTKIGTGMGEQLLSREYYYLGTQLPLDRFLSFYYAHAGFHIQNLFIILSVQLFMLNLVNYGALRYQVFPCILRNGAPITDRLEPTGCYNVEPVLDWVKRCVVSIFIVLFIAFIPLIVQELTERGAWRALTRFLKHFGSLSPIFEVFVCNIYANSLLTDFSLGGARYIATGRGFATARIPFTILYSRFAGPSIYLGARLLLMLLFATLTTWVVHLVYFWVSLLSLCISPFLYNPHQFAWTDFFVDYREFIRWLSRGNSLSHANSWIGYCRLSRTRITGYKRKVMGEPSDKVTGDIPRAHFTNVFFSEVIGPLILVILTLIPYLFINAQTGFVKNTNSTVKPSNPLIRVAIVSVLPIAINAGALITLAGMACCMGPCLMMCCKKFGSVLAALAHGIAVFVLVICFEVMVYLQNFNFVTALLGMVVVVAIQRFIFKTLTVLFLTRELKGDRPNTSFWTGKWVGSGMGWHSVSQPLREYMCKIIELSLFAADFLLGHFLLFLIFPVLLVPYIDRWHSMILFWLKPSRQIRPPLFTIKQNRLRKRIVRRYATLYFAMLVLFIAVLAGPIVAYKKVGDKIDKVDLPSIIKDNGLVQPPYQPPASAINYKGPKTTPKG